MNSNQQIIIPQRESLEISPEVELNGELIRFSASAVICRVLDEQPQFLLVEEQRREGILYNQPTGKIHISETPEQAVRREVLEETGFRSGPVKFLGNFRQDFESGPYIRYAFAVDIDYSAERRQIQDSKVVDNKWFSLEQILELAHEGKLRNEMILPSIYRYLALVYAEV